MHTNLLLDHLPVAERRRLAPHGALVTLQGGAPLATRDQPARALLFPLHGTVCLVTVLGEHPPLQVGMVGHEGVLGAASLLDARAHPADLLVQASGQAWRLPVSALRRMLPVSPTLHRLLSRYLVVQLRQTVTAAACLHFHALQPRLARWILMSHDRGDAGGLAVTQEALAHLLGVRRVGVTQAVGALEDAGLIDSRRGRLNVTDRAGLATHACGCYAQDLADYAAGLRFASGPRPAAAG